ncbi:LuxR C-terminal-related transcriptional regulator [uncultured Chryseobacterium sp.]|uniref:response regulator transcription factor n=1 Tax=uncultured Chryseobacterium sp. TaxID=259322 RepID=UPI0025CC19CE|nr:LuxR C-terminal-related transcriptional regulator [uncultured Chryseobacterium sp.]
MNENINGLFFVNSIVNEISSEKNHQLNAYLQVTEAFSRINYMSVYIIDYQNKNFEYVSDNPLFLCGHTAAEVMKMGYSFYFKCVKEDDLDLLLKINQVGFDFYNKIPVVERKQYTISYDFHMLNKKRPILINHKLTPIFLTESGQIWKAICVVSLSAHTNAGNMTIFKEGESQFWRYDFNGDYWKNEHKIKLSDRELDVLIYYAQGYTINEIADKIFVSPDTVKFYRRKLFEKMQVSSISQALSYVTNHKLL